MKVNNNNNNPFSDASIMDFLSGVKLDTETNVLSVGHTLSMEQELEENKKETQKLLHSLKGTVPDGLISLIEGYVDYAKEVVVNRALPNIDGLNPVQRRILYTMRVLEAVKDLKKCQLLAGKVLALHPHGDAAVYKAMVRLVDSSETMNISYLKGKGSFGKVYSNEKPSAARYTECMLNKIVDEFFGELNGVDFVPSYNNELEEPSLLPVSYPNILCNPTIGIAVGVASNIPPFNFNEVNKATIELIETGNIQEPLVPDFTTGGYYVRDDVELEKLMDTGKSKLKIRGKWYTEGRQIIITELPYYTDVQALQRVVQCMKGVTKEVDAIDKKGFKYTITCANKNIVDDVLIRVIRDTKLQMMVHTNVVVIVDGRPLVIGIKEILKRWVDFRVSVLEKDMAVELSKVKPEIIKNSVIIDLINSETKRDLLYTKLSKEGEESAIAYLKMLYDTLTMEMIEYILNIPMRSLTPKNRDRRQKELDKLKDRSIYLESALTNIKGIIVKQLKQLNKTYVTPRKTEVTDVDYNFEKEEVLVVKSEPVPVRFDMNGKFMKKLMVTDDANATSVGIDCMTDDIITFVDSLGRLLRVEVDKVPFCKVTDRGTYLPVFLGEEDNFDIICYDVTEEKEKAFMYSDGYISVLDYSEWANLQRVTKMTQKGISPLANLIVRELDLTSTHILVLTSEGRIGFASLDFKRKNRTARTKLIEGLNKDEVLTKVLPIDEYIMVDLLDNYEHYIGKVSMLRESDVFNSELYTKIIEESK